MIIRYIPCARRLTVVKKKKHAEENKKWLKETQ